MTATDPSPPTHPRATGGGPRRDWDAGTYDRVSDPQFRWALEQLERLDLRGDEVVLDAGCGSGRVTAVLADLVGRGKVYGVDVAPSMAEHAATALGDRATILCQDLVELDLPEPVDVIFSNATFHWVADHDALFAALHRGLKPRGRLLAQCGGRGNIDRFRRTADEVAREEPYAEYFQDWVGPWNYAGAPETADRLRNAGFIEVETWLQERPTPLEDPRPFVRTVCLVRHLDRLESGRQEEFLDAVLDRYERPFVLDYVRLNMTGRAS
ncbi:MAG TPA: methyltransferase domain-containing protein [Solirubrobacteraceae bacterium]|nr:methyltransferase domain-containing protein [Solirubrobacteraceae bacterium]